MLKDVLAELKIAIVSENTVIRPQSFDRSELRYRIVTAEPREAAASLEGIIASLPSRFQMSEADFFSARGEQTHSGIVFCPHVNGQYGVVQVAESLARLTGRPSAVYAGSAPRNYDAAVWESVKRENARRFKSNETPLLVSTKAFGMGIDKPNIRYVIHFGLPSSIEGYYQEVGRAGRDRHRAECALVLVEYDEIRDQRMLSEDVGLEEARRVADEVPRAQSDDITRQLFFHLNTFQGVDEELASVRGLLDDIPDLGGRQSIEIRFGDDRSSRERAIHRLVVLGVVRDYLVDWGSRKFALELDAVEPRDVVDRFADYVQRNQPQRLEAERASSARYASAPLHEAVLGCGRLLIEFVYDTIERSRRRSLREMWLAARESGSDPDGEFRQRILDYLTQGDVTPVLEGLVDRAEFSYGDWVPELQQVVTIDEARELRGSSARLLASYPDHPGLLIARGLSEARDPEGNLNELVSNVESSIDSAQRRYGVKADEVEKMAEWLTDFCRSESGPALTAATIALERSGAAPMLVRRLLEHALEEGESEPGLKVMALTAALQKTAEGLGSVAEQLEEARRG